MSNLDAFWPKPTDSAKVLQEKIRNNTKCAFGTALAELLAPSDLDDTSEANEYLSNAMVAKRYLAEKDKK
jgi:hypothetical protein